jgi:large subunit ribosomal protein L1
MAKHGKKYLAAAAKIDENKWYQPDEAVGLAKDTAHQV